jgi:glutamyl-tRNA synthetase
VPVPTGRFAPSPTGPLHVGNLRTALLAWLFARSSGSTFLVRIEDLDRAAAREHHVRAHLADLKALGLDWDGEVVRQSHRFDRYEAALDRLAADGLLYPCYCSRREVFAAVSAPHGPQPGGGAYPGTCRDLTPRDRAAREAGGRRPAWRVRAGGQRVEVVDRLHGGFDAVVDDFVVRRADGAPAYQLAVVVDDADQRVGEVVRGDDLLDSTPRQAWLGRRLELPIPTYAHVPLVLGADGERLAKRHGAVTLSDLAAAGASPVSVLTSMAVSLGLAVAGEADAAATAGLSADALVAILVERFDPAGLPRRPWTFHPVSAA